MARKQVRHSVSVRGVTYQRVKDYVATKNSPGLTGSGFLEEVLLETLGESSAPVLETNTPVQETPPPVLELVPPEPTPPTPPEPQKVDEPVQEPIEAKQEPESVPEPIPEPPVIKIEIPKFDPPTKVVQAILEKIPNSPEMEDYIPPILML